MIYLLSFLPDIQDDVIAGYSWYEAKSPGLGEEFIRVFYACAGEITTNPLVYPKVYDEFHRCLLRRFPYAVYFHVKDEQITVFGLFHCARDPRTIKGHLNNR